MQVGVQMSPQEIGFAETLGWLRRGTKGERPLPPESYSNEDYQAWWSGSDKAFNEFPARQALEEAKVTFWEDMTIHIMKCAFIVLSTWLIFDVDSLFFRGIGAVALFLLLKSMVVRTDTEK